MTDKKFKHELIKRHALSTTIYDEGGMAQTFLPFKHLKEDVEYQRLYELKYLKKVILADFFEDIEGMGLEFGKEDFVDEA